MYNINFSFLNSSEVDSVVENPDNKYNELFKNKIISTFNLDINSPNNTSSEQNESRKTDPRVIVEAISRGLIGKHFCEVKKDKSISLEKNDLILIQVKDGIEIANIEEVGEIVSVRRYLLGLHGEELPFVIRKLNEEDLEKYRTNLTDEVNARPIFKEKVDKYKLEMKLVDIHFQFDRKKLYFYYTSDGRVDFRELAKDLASEFKTRIELRQIGVRDEAKRIGGLGTCGREYCCSTFINGFKKITTQIACDQNHSQNLSKLSGPCGKLKCCLSFESENN